MSGSLYHSQHLLLGLKRNKHDTALQIRKSRTQNLDFGILDPRDTDCKSLNNRILNPELQNPEPWI